MKHHSATFEIAYRAGVHPRTVRRYTRRRVRTWLRLSRDDIDLVVAALCDGQARCPSQPRRHAVPFDQLTLDFS